MRMGFCKALFLTPGPHLQIEEKFKAIRAFFDLECKMGDGRLRPRLRARGGDDIVKTLALRLAEINVENRMIDNARGAGGHIAFEIGLKPVEGVSFFHRNTERFRLFDRLIEKRGGAGAQLMAMLLDFVPESLALGAMLTTQKSVGLLLAGAAALIAPDLAAGVLTLATSVWVLLGLFGLSQLFTAVRRALA